MKNNKIQDERILLERRKIQSNGYAWIILALLVSIIVQQFFMKAPFEQYAVEFFLVMACGVYNIICNYNKGIDIWNREGYGKKKMLIDTILAGVLSVILLALLGSNFDTNNLIFFFFIFVIFSYVFRLIMAGINNKKQKTINKKLNEDDNESLK